MYHSNKAPHSSLSFLKICVAPSSSCSFCAGQAAAAAREDDKRHDERHDERCEERDDERRDEEGDGGGGDRVVAGVTRAQWIARGFPAKEFDQHDADGSGAFSAAELTEWEAADALRDAAPSEGASDSLQHAACQVPRARALWLADGFPAEEFDAFDPIYCITPLRSASFSCFAASSFTIYCIKQGCQHQR